MTEYEYAQAVMKAAGVKPSKAIASWVETFFLAPSAMRKEFTSPEEAYKYLAHRHERVVLVKAPEVEIVYPDPLTSGDGFLALWDALVARNYSVTVSHKAYGSAAVCVHAEGALARWQFHADRAVALVEAAGQELGVTR